jgi:nitroimidazol reductase NimA-like FMN-containing flavoprotein (pyridoxamine 5'-phosphate oxidase superfamily)
MTSITDPEVSAFLRAGTRTGKLAFASADGRPLVTPVWFIVEDDCLQHRQGDRQGPGSGPRSPHHDLHRPG